MLLSIVVPRGWFVNIIKIVEILFVPNPSTKFKLNFHGQSVMERRLKRTSNKPLPKIRHYPLPDFYITFISK